jgi:hypothetical protein
MYKYLAIILSLVAVYGAWSYNFFATGLDNIECKSKDEAQRKAELLSVSYSKSRVIKTSGFSNSLSGYFKKGYTVIIEVSYDDLNKNDFVVYRYSKGLILHRLRIKTDKGWIVEGDGNDAPDPILVTKDNLVGIVLHKKVYRY